MPSIPTYVPWVHSDYLTISSHCSSDAHVFSLLLNSGYLIDLVSNGTAGTLVYKTGIAYNFSAKL